MVNYCCAVGGRLHLVGILAFVHTVDPCATNNGGCLEYCTPVGGEAVCSCSPGTYLKTNGYCGEMFA